MSSNGDLRPSRDQENAAYQARLIEYQADLDSYHEAMREWNSLSAEEREVLNRMAEEESRSFWSGLLAIAVTVGLYILLDDKLKGDAFWWAWGSASLVCAILIVSLHQILGPFVRGLFFSSLTAIITYFVISFIQSAVTNPPSLHLKIIVTIVLGVIGFLVGVFGRATAEPRKPARPISPR